MFFLLYMPEAKTPEAREAIRAQLQQMLIALQDQLEQAGLLDADALDDEATAQQLELAQQPAAIGDQSELHQEPESPELSDMRNYLERCFKKTA
jgi:hypothetical protein